ncbi:Cysteine--tRNA ligase [Candidatus Clavichlamydia salmonicola]|uniref:cysteine--tRNA ligase n=1 Tax=Candidatus Clavichlamydia salmonicola TaxID=469812 RepID=UPI00189124AB|nr:cysteine--tRNA ligase [Candidatus Clavichlamydia salmonicola]MBF5050477.1 Cysteine--tRNA ligase [Candidatus Clavichlamydia salmonicola]
MLKDNRTSLKISFKLYNTKTRKKEIFEASNKVLMYTCGPTVYNFAHIGNFRTYVFEDILRRVLEFLGYQTFHVMNITDIEDKIMKAAVEKGCSVQEFTQPYTDAFMEDIKTLGLLPAHEYPYATKYIPQMIEAIEKLIRTGFAYKTASGSVYFSINKSPSYGCLAHINTETTTNESNGNLDDEYDKDDVADFALWKAYNPSRDGNIFWESSFGPGRPGWHIECSVMAMSILGPTIDIHAGGVDNIFPHHENEIAQSEALSGQCFSRFWVHSEHLLVDKKKMSKSAGNFYTLRDLLQKDFTGMEVRYMLLQGHYRSQLNFSEQGMIASRNSLKRLNEFVFALETSLNEKTADQNYNGWSKNLSDALDSFTLSLANDLNVSEALAILFGIVQLTRPLINSQSLSAFDIQNTLDLLKTFNLVLNILTFNHVNEISNELMTILDARNTARKEKDWSKADEMRLILLEKGFIIEDTPNGSFLKKLN